MGQPTPPIPPSAAPAPEFPTASVDQWKRAAAKSAPDGDLGKLDWTRPRASS